MLSLMFTHEKLRFLLEKYCPDPKTLPTGLTELQKAAYYSDAYTIWYYFTAIGLTSAIALIAYKFYYRKKDLKSVGN